MRLAFSECTPDYEAHLAPYQVLGFPEDGETAATAFGLGMLPSNRELTRFYLARSVRVDLGRYTESRRERYVRRQCETLRRAFLPRAQLDRPTDWADMCVRYMNERSWWTARRGRPFRTTDLMARLDSPLTTHLLTLTHTSDNAPAALATLYVEPPIAYYALAFYDTRYRKTGIGSHLMSCVIGELKRRGLSHVYLGTCYYEGARYKTRFTGMEFFDGLGWSDDRERLRLFLSRQKDLSGQHLFDHPSYLDAGQPPRPEDTTLWLADASQARHIDSVEEP
ncbi:GNAT family N-acetyltransferase [Streptomyces sp. NPDC053474]|uniref:GNAT family N-acetyltransferase n=1 Tax=Streptomyces sp. NPDC053474 TaxID=3365704 RepID=UPI0037CE1BE8